MSSRVGLSPIRLFRGYRVIVFYDESLFQDARGGGLSDALWSSTRSNMAFGAIIINDILKIKQRNYFFFYYYFSIISAHKIIEFFFSQIRLRFRRFFLFIIVYAVIQSFTVESCGEKQSGREDEGRKSKNSLSLYFFYLPSPFEIMDFGIRRMV